MIGVAIIGAGIGAQHLKGYRALPHRYAIKTLCDLDTDRARIIVGDDPNIDIVAEIDAVLADPAIQLVDICLPPHLHFPIIKAALAAGKDVICEKPLVRALAEAEEITAIAAASGRHVFPVFQYRFGRAMRHLRALMDAGIAGKALVASSEVHWSRGKGYYDVPWRGTWKGEYGGAVLGHAIYAHDFLCCVLGPLAQVSAFTATRVNDIEVEDCAAISLRFASGALATSSVTLGAGNDTSRLRFCFAGFTAQSGTAPYKPAEDDWQFINGQLAFYYSGSWQVRRFDKEVGDSFDWEVVGPPCCGAACSGMPGGSGTVGFKQTKHPELVGKILNYLAQEANYREFSERTSNIPAHKAVTKAGPNY